MATVAEMSAAERIPEPFLHQILLSLVGSGFLCSRRGRAGGFSLARPSAQIPLGSVVRAIDGPLAPIPCASVTAYEPCPSCVAPEQCDLRAVMRRVRDAAADILDRTSLADVASGQRHAPLSTARPRRASSTARRSPAR